MNIYDMLIAQKISGGGGGSITPQLKNALLAAFSKVAWVDENGNDYYSTLQNALYDPADLSSISAVYSGGSIEEGTTLDSLKSSLVVTANWSDSSTSTVGSAYYTLSGSLSAGTSTITVSYLGKTTTFNVTVQPWDLVWTYEDGGLPHSSASSSWTLKQMNAGITSFVADKGIYFNGNGTYQIYPTQYETTTQSTYQVKFSFTTLPTTNGVILRLGNGTIGTQVTIGTNGKVSLDNGTTYLDGVSIATGTEYTAKSVCDTTGTCYFYLDNVLVWTGSASAIGSKTNQFMLTSTSMSVYVSEIKFRV